MTSKRQLILDWANDGHVADGQLENAMRHVGVIPDRLEWRAIIDRLLLAVGELTISSGVMFFFAYNWDDLGRFLKFAIVEGLIVLSLAMVWWRGLDTMPGQAALFLSSFLVGVLLALIGQTYQTGADPYQLFAVWAVLIIPWALLGRSVLILILSIILMNVAGSLYYQTFGGFFGLVLGFFKNEYLWMIFVFNTLILACWEFMVNRGVDWMRSTWATRLLATTSGVAITGLMIEVTFGGVNWITFIVWLLWLFAIYQFYRLRQLDVYILAGACLSIIVSITSMLAETMLDADGAGLLILGLLIIGLTAASGSWLRKVVKSERGEEENMEERQT